MADLKPPPPAELWERQAYETEESFEAFKNYRDMAPGQRRLTRAASHSKTTLQRWYQDNRWDDRVRAFDAKFEAARLEEREAAFRVRAREIEIDHRLLLSDFRELVSREVAKYVEASRSSTMHGLIKPADLIRMSDMMVKLDRLVRGQSTENVGDAKMNYAGLSEEELDALNELLEKASKDGDDKPPAAH